MYKLGMFNTSGLKRGPFPETVRPNSVEVEHISCYDSLQPHNPTPLKGFATEFGIRWRSARYSCHDFGGWLVSREKLRWSKDRNPDST